MKISDAKNCIIELYRYTNSVTALVSERGVGKTSAYQQCAEDMGIAYKAVYAAALEGPDFMGLPNKDVTSGVTRYLAPEFLPTKAAIRNGLFPSEGILVLEEINRVPSDTVSVLYPLLLEKKINGHELGDGWHIGVTMNPDNLNYLVNTLDDAMLDRFIAIQVEADLEDYINYSRTQGGNEEVLSFLKSNPDMLLMINEAMVGGVMTKSPTPRAWTKVQEVINHTNLPNHLLTELLTGIVGKVAASTFVGFRTGWKLDVPSAKMILKDYSLEQEKVRQLIEERQTPIMTKVIDHIIHLLEEDNLMIEQLDLFLKDMPDELGVYFYKVLARDNAEMMTYISERSLHFDYVSDLIVDRMTL